MLRTGWCGMNVDMSTVHTQSPTACPACNSTLAYPIDWQRLAAVLWLTWLRCPNCESIIPRVLDDDAVYALDEALDRGTYALAQELKTIALAWSTDPLAPRRRARALRPWMAALVVVGVVAVAAAMSAPAAYAAARATFTDGLEVRATCTSERGVTRVVRRGVTRVVRRESRPLSAGTRRAFRRCVRPRQHLSAVAPPARAGAPLSSHAMLHTCCTPSAMKERIFAESKAMGARFIRVDVELAAIFDDRDLQPDGADWTRLDEVIELSRRYRLPVLGIVMSPPAWLSNCPEAGAAAVRCAPHDLREFGRLAGEVAAHARDTISHWEIVNEPDGIWAFEGSPEEYARMLRAAFDGIKARVPDADVAMGGVMTPQDRSWIERVLATPGADAAHAFDIANLHLRGRASALPRQLVAWRDLLGRHGFEGPVWVTEHGYPAEPAYQSDPAFRGGEPAQAAYLTESVLALAEAGAGEVFVTLRDNLEGGFASEGVVTLHAGPQYLARRKPAFTAVRRLVDRWDELTAARAEQRREVEAMRQESRRARAARAGLASLRLRWLRARRLHIRARPTRRLTRAQLRRRRDELGRARAIAGIHRLRAAIHVQRALELADYLARR
jgi:hypothetical protein